MLKSGTSVAAEVGVTLSISISKKDRSSVKDGGKPPEWEKWARKDIYRIGDVKDSSREMTIAIRFREFMGSYMEHCHNTQHEDHAQLLRWDIEQPGQTVPIRTPMPTWEGVGYVDSFTLSTYKKGDVDAKEDFDEN